MNHEVQPAAFPARVELPYYSIRDLATRWRCSRATVYNRLRGELLLDFARGGCRGQKLVPAETVRRVETKHMNVWR